MPSAPDPFIARLAGQFGDDLLRYLSRRVRTVADARDLAQEAYVRLLRLERKDLIRDPQPYLYRIAANLVHEFELKRRAQAAGLQRWATEQSLDSGSQSADREAEALGLSRRLQEVLEELTPKCRAVLVLHRRDGMTYDEIAARIGISSSMVKKYLAAGLRHCRARLRDLV
jgi:RNA polymerase sigma factor (sigma-70 family)